MDGVRSIINIFVFISDLQADVGDGRIGDAACVGLNPNVKLSHYDEIQIRPGRLGRFAR
jgi:hypothetical protein